MVKIKVPATARVSHSDVADALGADYDLLNLNSVKLGREDNSVEINGPTDCSCLVIVMLSDSGHVVLNAGGEAELRNFLNRRHSRSVRARQKEFKQR